MSVTAESRLFILYLYSDSDVMDQISFSAAPITEIFPYYFPSYASSIQRSVMVGFLAQPARIIRESISIL